MLAKVLEALVSEQVNVFSHSNTILLKYLSGFRQKHSTITAALKVVNDISVALDKKLHCASLFIDLSNSI